MESTVIYMRASTKFVDRVLGLQRCGGYVVRWVGLRSCRMAARSSKNRLSVMWWVAALEGSLIGWATPAATRLRFKKNGVAWRDSDDDRFVSLLSMLNKLRRTIRWKYRLNE